MDSIDKAVLDLDLTSSLYQAVLFTVKTCKILGLIMAAKHNTKRFHHVLFTTTRPFLRPFKLYLMALPCTKKQPVYHLSIIVRSSSIYLTHKPPFLTPPSSSDRLSRPFKFSRWLSNLSWSFYYCFHNPFHLSYTKTPFPNPSIYLRSPFTTLSILSLALKSILVILPFFAKPFSSILHRNSLS